VATKSADGKTLYYKVVNPGNQPVPVVLTVKDGFPVRGAASQSDLDHPRSRTGRAAGVARARKWLGESRRRPDSKHRASAHGPLAPAERGRTMATGGAFGSSICRRTPHETRPSGGRCRACRAMASC